MFTWMGSPFTYMLMLNELNERMHEKIMVNLRNILKKFKTLPIITHRKNGRVSFRKTLAKLSGVKEIEKRFQATSV